MMHPPMIAAACFRSASIIRPASELRAARRALFQPCSKKAGKQKTVHTNRCENKRMSEKTGAGEGIRTLDPNLGKVVLYP